MDQVLVNKLSRRLKAEKMLLESLVEFLGETSGENATPLDQEDLEHVQDQLDKINAERKLNRAFYKNTVKRVAKAQTDAKTA